MITVFDTVDSKNITKYGINKTMRHSPKPTKALNLKVVKEMFCVGRFCILLKACMKQL